MCLENNIDGWRYRCPKGHVTIKGVNNKIKNPRQDQIPTEWKGKPHYRCMTCGIRFANPIDMLNRK